MDIDISTADEYFKTRIGAENWFELDDNQKTSALTTALNKISKLSFIGIKVLPDQETIFPRIFHGKKMPK